MNRETLIVLLLLVGTFVSGTIAATVVQERKSKKVTRVKRPQFTEKDWDGIYFEDLFKEGLVGPRPDKLKPGERGANPNPVAQTDSPTGDNDAAEFAWSKFLTSETIEDEVKLIQKQLALDVTTPVKFKSEYAKAHQSFSVLSLLFGIIREYDGEVRWKRYASEAQISFERAAANSRVGTIQAYESCKRRKGDLEEMVRGGNFEVSEKPPETLDWSVVVYRTPIMKRLQISKDALKLLSANKGEFTDGIDKALHESEIVAALAQTLIRENMEDADDDGYWAFATEMSDAAIQAKRACANQDYEAAAKAINLIDQSCNNCHDEWR